MPYNTLAIHRLVALTEQQSHLAPDIPFTVDCAHAVMQFHVGCRAAFCLRKAAALDVLVAAGLVVPSTAHPR
ncbi:hypothetical protein BJY24_007351 [Nocardia transvalensis]|uniref:Uncharacterized protein n=1 Tax=Nocardia transvalensis TaxID=37333 RepID=A0A7W9UMB3_9NOCA|nr:hypothetical protein [Nocardia transvalensis]MBB5918439.1 hypothetical protein [Nocardia transvalensis]